MRKFDAVLFDIDGTLLDSTELLFQAFEHTLATHKLPPKSRKEIGSLIGRHIRLIYEQLAPSHEFETLFETHVSFQADNPHLSKRFPKTKRTLEQLKRHGVKIGTLSNRFRTATKSLEVAGISNFIDLVISGDDVINVKPHPEPVLKALAHFAIPKSKAVMIGDTKEDVAAGKNAGIVTIGVTYGFHGEKIAESNPDFLVDDIADILPIILP